MAFKNDKTTVAKEGFPLFWLCLTVDCHLKVSILRNEKTLNIKRLCIFIGKGNLISQKMSYYL